MTSRRRGSIRHQHRFIGRRLLFSFMLDTLGVLVKFGHEMECMHRAEKSVIPRESIPWVSPSARSEEDEEEDIDVPMKLTPKPSQASVNAIASGSGTRHSKSGAAERAVEVLDYDPVFSAKPYPFNEAFFTTPPAKRLPASKGQPVAGLSCLRCSAPIIHPSGQPRPLTIRLSLRLHLSAHARWALGHTQGINSLGITNFSAHSPTQPGSGA